MHKALHVRDIVLDIVAHVPKGSLVALARTSKALSEPALDGIWREMGSLDPVYQTLPAGVWTKDFGGQLVLAKAPIKPKDWARLVSYANRIHTLSLEGGLVSRVNFLKVVKYHLPRGVDLFNNLRVLRLVQNNPDAEFFLALSILLRPTLQTVALTAASTDCVVATLSHAQFRCHDVQELHIAEAFGVLPMIDHFVCLRTLVYDNPVDTVDLHLMLSLARLPHLRKLKITSRFTPNPPCSDAQPAEQDVPSFPALEELSLTRVADLKAVSDLLHLISSSALCSVSLAYEASAGLRELSNSLSQRGKLKLLHLESLAVPQAGTSVFQHVMGLAALTELADVRLMDVFSQDDLGSDGVRALTKYWGRLRTLHIVCKSWHDNSTTPKAVVFNPGVLLSLATNNPHLREIRMAAIWPHGWQTSYERIGHIRRDTPLRLLLCSASALGNDNAYDVAEYISHLYPNVDLTYEGSEKGSYGQKYGSRWAEVKRLIGRIGRTRAAERRIMEAEMLKAVESVSFITVSEA
ncbi:hypothetical protein PsYK624_105080 [Phanerochaete sordida]|uniref:F-box domain-containing protein n=1 Tax=Phanerochaete sordida TaxID=48140 RepID=A0A9P3GIR7_9APHY|nr:hypothetical protein PsYK624_105080 [Phanerochaete sordida]